MDLRDYENAKFELASLLRQLAEAVKDEGEAAVAEIRELFVRLAEDRFNLVVVGRFGRGKSSLMNAVIGMERLPTGILPLTSVITTVAYGSRDNVVVHYEGRHLPAEIAVDELAQYVTQQANPGNVRHVKTVEVQLPAEILRRGFHFIDTPGLGSAIAENTATTEAFLPEADALLIVTSYDSPLSEEELAVLRLAAKYGRRVFMVINKQDTVTSFEREQGLAYVGEQIGRVLGPRASAPFSVSARDGLAAKLAGAPDALRESGLAALEDELVRFLVEEKRQAFLASFCERMLLVARRRADSAAAADIALQVRAFQRRLEPTAVPETGEARVAPLAAARMGSLLELAPCEICEHVQTVSFDFLCRYQYELSVDPKAQDRHAQTRGLCAVHTRQLAALAAPRGVATGYPALLDALSATLAEAARAASAGLPHALARRDLLPDAAACALCRLCAQAADEAMQTIRERLRRNPGAALDGLSAICMLHLPALVAGIDDAALAAAVLAREAGILARLAEDLRRYATRLDAIRRQLASAEETAAADRSLKLVAGLVNVPTTDAGDSGPPP